MKLQKGFMPVYRIRLWGEGAGSGGSVGVGELSPEVVGGAAEQQLRDWPLCHSVPPSVPCPCFVDTHSRWWSFGTRSYSTLAQQAFSTADVQLKTLLLLLIPRAPHMVGQLVAALLPMLAAMA